ncbi:MAG: hypothetical protein IT438_06810 [Phycisphaerales bacterium]|nr:hypothetical protein [Phycisphaerales bacterium]
MSLKPKLLHIAASAMPALLLVACSNKQDVLLLVLPKAGKQVILIYEDLDNGVHVPVSSSGVARLDIPMSGKVGINDWNIVFTPHELKCQFDDGSVVLTEGLDAQVAPGTFALRSVGVFGDNLAYFVVGTQSDAEHAQRLIESSSVLHSGEGSAISVPDLTLDRGRQ